MKSRRLIISLACGLACLFASNSTDAVTVTAKFKGVSPGMNVTMYADSDGDAAYELSATTSAGLYTWEAISSDFEAIEPGATFVTFCLDIGQHVSGNGVYTFTVDDINNAPLPPTYSLTTISQEDELALQKLYALYYGEATQGLVMKAAAFQAAVWEIVNEHWLDFDVLDGSFKVRSDWTPAVMANQWLDSLDDYVIATAQLPQVVALVSSTAQDQMFMVPGGGNDVPEPITLAGLLMGLGAVGYRLRRRISA